MADSNDNACLAEPDARGSKRLVVFARENSTDDDKWYGDVHRGLLSCCTRNSRNFYYTSLGVIMAAILLLGAHLLSSISSGSDPHAGVLSHPSSNGFLPTPNVAVANGSAGRIYNEVIGTYTEREARVFLQYARASFCAKQAVESWTCGDSCRDAPAVPNQVRFIGPGYNFDVQGYVAVMPSSSAGQHKCIVAFRGSVNIENWEGDGLFFPKLWPTTDCRSGHCRPADGRDIAWCPECMVHRGFAGAYEDLRPDLFKAIRELGCNDVAVSGHSLGAAVATLATIELRARFGFQAYPVYLYGAPRVGNAAFAAVFAEAAINKNVDPPAWRLVHYRDPVPRIVPRMPPFGFRHVPVEVWYPTKAEDYFKVCDVMIGEDKTCSDSIPLSACIPSLDHLEYLGLSLKTKDFVPECYAKDASKVLGTLPAESY